MSSSASWLIRAPSANWGQDQRQAQSQALGAVIFRSEATDGEQSTSFTTYPPQHVGFWKRNGGPGFPALLLPCSSLRNPALSHTALTPSLWRREAGGSESLRPVWSAWCASGWQGYAERWCLKNQKERKKISLLPEAKAPFVWLSDPKLSYSAAGLLQGLLWASSHPTYEHAARSGPLGYRARGYRAPAVLALACAASLKGHVPAQS